MKIVLLCVGKTSESYLESANTIYLKRLQHYYKTDLQVIPDLKKVTNMSVDERKKKEGELIIKQLEAGDRVVLLDEKGKDFTSRQFSSYLEKIAVSGAKRLVFVVGGAFGFSDDVYALASGKVALSKMTFSHQMVRLFFLEQIYRACTILNNEPYHND